MDESKPPDRFALAPHGHPFLCALGRCTGMASAPTETGMPAERHARTSVRLPAGHGTAHQMVGGHATPLPRSSRKIVRAPYRPSPGSPHQLTGLGGGVLSSLVRRSLRQRGGGVHASARDARGGRAGDVSRGSRCRRCQRQCSRAWRRFRAVPLPTAPVRSVSPWCQLTLLKTFSQLSSGRGRKR